MEGGASTLPAAFTTLLTAIWGQLTSFISAITENPLLLIPVGFAFIGGIIGIGQRMMGTRRRRR